ncbi:hypothetical protein [Lentzea sp. NPDC051838]|uniref:hypothetical protein n=1 Tax=Lentzea sp. NPDC051838 TaxID=3154849 RepID=UPI00343FDC72
MGDLVGEAHALLADGRKPEEVFVALAVDGRRHYEVALAVCVALGIPEAEAAERLEPDDGLWDDPEIEPEDAAWMLDVGGLFDVHVQLSAEDQQVADQLWCDYRARGDSGSGYVFYFSRLIKMGRLDDARRFLEEHPSRR